jgi:predicted aspartyl protease
METMGRITAHIRVSNLLDPARAIECDALVDTGAAYLVLPTAWRERLGELSVFGEVECETATQDLVRAPVCGPAEIQIEGFRCVNGQVIFLDMHPVNGRFEPLIGYIVLEQSNAAVDMLGQRLIDVRKTDLK